MTCPRCHAENRDGARFCRECGATLAAVCADCGAKVEAGSKFCDSCGASLSATPARPTAARRFDSPESYTPRHLAEKILTSKTALEGERKQVTVLFADLKGSMELLADRDPEEARKLLDPVLERMMEAVHHYEGTVNQVMGDGIMALFGAPLAHEDHAVRACYAALRMQRRVALYADELQRGGGTPVQIRVGLNSGEVVVRAIGSDLRMDYTAVGQTTHLAARMEQMAKPGSVLATADTLRLAEGYVQVRPLGSLPVKGLETPASVYELTGTVPARSRFQATAARGLTRFVGRERELEQLGQALARAAAGHGQAVAIVGEAGVGKSRLVWEVTHSHRTHGWLVLESGSVSYGKATPYLPVIDLLKAYCRIQERDDPRAIRERVAGKLLMLDRTLEPLLTPLLALLDVPVEDAAWDALDPPQRRQRTLEAVKRLLLRESQVQPVLVVFEDLHWIDTETQALLDGLVESLPTARLLLLVNYRPEYQHGWGGKTYYLQLRIDLLPPQSAEELLHALLGDDRSLAPLTQMLIERTEGNPFFLEESVRTLVETQVLVGERGAYRMAKAPDAWQIPATAQAILAARIDRLPPEDKRLLQAASVVGKDVPFALLQAIADLPEEPLRRGLAHLQSAEFLYETSLFPDLEYTFKHALTHEVAFGSLLHERRSILHARIVGAFETLYPDRLTEHAERLAHHALRGERWDKAVTYLGRAGAKAEARAANREAVEYFEQALEALTHIPESQQTVEQAIELRFELRRPLFQLGETARMLAYLRDAAALADRLGDRVKGGWARAQLGGHAWITGDHGPGLELAEEAYRTAVETGDLALRVHAALRVGWACHALGDYTRAAMLLHDSVTAIPGNSAAERFGHVGLPAVMARSFLAWCLAEQGVFAEGRAHGAEAIRIANALDHRFSRVMSVTGLGMTYLMSGRFHEAVDALASGHDLGEQVSVATAALFVAPALGLAYARTDAVAKGLALLEESVGYTAARNLLLYQPLRLAALAETYLLAGRTGEALDYGRRAVDLARTQRERGHEAHALRLLGEITMRGVVSELAHAHYCDALALATELGMRPLVAHCHLGLGLLYRGTHDPAKAHEHLTTAATLYREMGMTFWLEKTGSLLGTLETNTP
jgi:class 3 adenylate cyclase/tetratricopeptide (TPR) repeat protein